MNRIRHNTTTHGILTAAAKSGMYYLASWQDGLSKALVMPRMAATAKVVVDNISQGISAGRGLKAGDLDELEVHFNGRIS